MSMAEGMFDGLRAELEATQADLSAAREEVETWKWRHEQDTARLETALLAACREVEAAAKRAKYAEATLDNIRFTTSIEGARQLADNYFAGRAALAATQEEK